MKQFFGLFVLVLMVFLGSCELVTLEPFSDVPNDLSLSGDIQPIFNSNCVSCHGGSRAPDLRTGKAYNDLITGGFIDTDDPENSTLYSVLEGSHSSRASDKEKAYILGWIKQGTKNN